MPLIPSLPNAPLIKDVCHFNPPTFHAWCEAEEKVMRGPAALPPGEWELSPPGNLI